MLERYRVYLAGPEVFLPESLATGEAKKALCAQHGFEGLYPLDNDIAGRQDDRGAAFLIFAGNRAMMDGADAIIANLSPFRGVSADPGTVFELGYMIGRGKPAAGYTLAPASFFDRVRGDFGPVRFDTARDRWLDRHAWSIENFGLSDNLMMEGALQAAGIPLVRQDAPAAGGTDWRPAFEECLRRLRRRFDG